MLAVKKEIYTLQTSSATIMDSGIIMEKKYNDDIEKDRNRKLS